MSRTPPMTPQRRLASYGAADSAEVAIRITPAQRRRMRHKANRLHAHPVGRPVRGPEPSAVILDEAAPPKTSFSAAEIIGALDLRRVISVQRDQKAARKRGRMP